MTEKTFERNMRNGILKSRNKDQMAHSKYCRIVLRCVPYTVYHIADSCVIFFGKNALRFLVLAEVI